MKQKGICMKRIIYIVTACAFLSVSTAKAQQVLTLKECLEEGLQNNYSLRIVHNEEQISKNNATLGNAGYFPTLDFSAGYTGNLDNIESKESTSWKPKGATNRPSPRRRCSRKPTRRSPRKPARRCIAK